MRVFLDVTLLLRK